MRLDFVILDQPWATWTPHYIPARLGGWPNAGWEFLLQELDAAQQRADPWILPAVLLQIPIGE